MASSQHPIGFNQPLQFLLITPYCNWYEYYQLNRLLTCIGGTLYDLYSNEVNDFTGLANQWTITGLIDPNQRVYLCNNYLLGGAGILQLNGIMERLYTDLPSHNFVSYAFRIFAFGNWQSTDNINLYFDGVQILQWAPSLIPGWASPASCNGYTYTDVYEMGTVAHVSSSITVTLISSVPSNTPGLSFGLRGSRFLLITSTTDITFPSCLQTNNIIGSGCGCPIFKYPDPSTPGNCLDCPSGCSQCSGPSNNDCYACNWGYFYDGQQCVVCAPNCILCSGPNSNQCSYCQSGYRINWDGTCGLPTDPCPSPYTTLFLGDVVACNTPCTLSEQYTYQDKSCSSTCDSPFTPRIVGTAQFCDGPCSNPSYFYYPSTQQCQPTCPYPYQIDGVNFCILKLDEQDASEMQTINSALTAGSYGISIAAIVLSILNAANPSGYTLAMLAEIIQYIRLLKITYPPKLQYMLDQSDSFSIEIIPSIPDAVEEKLTNHEMPGKFERYENYSSFLANFWQSMITLALILVGAGISSFLAKKAKGYKYFGWFWQKMKFWLKWNFFLMTISSYFGDIIVYSSLEFRTYSRNAALDPLSLGICVFINLFAVVVLARMIYVNMSVRKIYSKSTTRKKDPQVIISEQWEDYGILYESYKQRSIFAQGFFIFFIFRLLFFYVTIAYLFDYPLVQSILITCLSLISLFYIVIIRPFKQIMDFISNILQEFILLTVNICALSLAIFDIAEKSNYNDRLIPGDIIIYCNIAFNVIGFIGMILQVGILLWNIYGTIRNKFNKKLAKDSKRFPNTRNKTGPESLPEMNLSSDPLAQSSIFSDSQHDMHILNTHFHSQSRRGPSTNSFLQDNRVNMIKQPKDVPKIKFARPTMTNEESRPTNQDNIRLATEKIPPFRKIHRAQKNESQIRNIYEMNGNKARSQAQGSNYNH